MFMGTEFTMVTNMTTMTRIRGGVGYKFLLLFLKFDTCFVQLVFVNFFSNCEFPF